MLQRRVGRVGVTTWLRRRLPLTSPGNRRYTGVCVAWRDLPAIPHCRGAGARELVSGGGVPEGRANGIVTEMSTEVTSFSSICNFQWFVSPSSSFTRRHRRANHKGNHQAGGGG